eukprot:Clim_evm2s125 gene=Clim_evmTU2s125
MNGGLFAAKLLGSLIVLIFGYVCTAILPLHLKENKLIQSRAQAFCGGVFLAIGFLHMLPEASDTLEYSDRTFYIPDPEGGNKAFPLAFLFLCVMVLFILLLEKVLFQGLDELLQKHTKEDECPQACCDIENGGITTVAQRKSIEVAEVQKGDGLSLSSSYSDADEKDKPIAYIMLLILCVHSIFAGASVGLASTFRSALVIWIAIIAHKGFAGFALGCEFIKAGLKRHFHHKLAIVFSLATPLGIAIGAGTQVALEDTSILPWIDGMFGAFGGGTFAYLAMVIVFAEYFNGDKSERTTNFLLLCIGFVLMAVPAVFA